MSVGHPLTDEKDKKKNFGLSYLKKQGFSQAYVLFFIQNEGIITIHFLTILGCLLNGLMIYYT